MPEGRVWELLARGVITGTPEGDSMRVFLKAMAGPMTTAAPRDEPPKTNGNGGAHGPGEEASAFRELLTEFRNLTERYGQALLALGEARGEVAGLRSRVELLEARLDLRLPASSGPIAAEAPIAAETPGAAETPAAEPDVPEPSIPEAVAPPVPRAAKRTAARPAPAGPRPAKPKRGPVRRKPARARNAPQSTRSAMTGFADALARAQDPAVADVGDSLPTEEAIGDSPPTEQAIGEATTELDAEGILEPTVTGSDIADELLAGVEANSLPDVTTPDEIAAVPEEDRATSEALVDESGAPPAGYSTAVAEPDWFADGDFAWLEAANVGARSEPGVVLGGQAPDVPESEPDSDPVSGPEATASDDLAADEEQVAEVAAGAEPFADDAAVPDAEPITETAFAAEATLAPDAALGVETETAVEAEQMAEPEATAYAESVAEPETVAEDEPRADSDRADDAELFADDAEQTADVQSSVEPDASGSEGEQMAEPEASGHAEPMAEPAAVADAEQTPEIEPTVEAEPTTEAVAVSDAELGVDTGYAEPVAEPESVAEAEQTADVEAEPTTEAAAVSDLEWGADTGYAEPMAESEASGYAEPMAEPEAVADAEQSTEIEPTVEAEPTTEAAAVSDAEWGVAPGYAEADASYYPAEQMAEPESAAEAEPRTDAEPTTDSAVASDAEWGAEEAAAADAEPLAESAREPWGEAEPAAPTAEQEPDPPATAADAEAELTFPTTPESGEFMSRAAGLGLELARAQDSEPEGAVEAAQEEPSPTREPMVHDARSEAMPQLDLPTAVKPGRRGKAEAAAFEEEELMWLGTNRDDELEDDAPAPSPPIAEPRSAPAAPGTPQSPTVDTAPGTGDMRPPLAMTEEELAQLARDEGWDDAEVAAIRAMIWRPSAPGVELPGAAELDEAMAALHAVPAEPGADAKPSGGQRAAADDDWAFDEPSAPLRPADGPPYRPRRPAADADWTRNRKGPAASAYRRLRRLFPG